MTSGGVSPPICRAEPAADREGADFGGEAQEHDAERLGPDEPEPRGMVGKPRLGGAEQTVVLHQVHGDVHGDGEHDELGQAAAEPFPCLERGALEGDFFLRQPALDTVLAMKGRQEEMPEAHREQGPQRGRREGQPRIDKGGSASTGQSMNSMVGRWTM